MHRISVVQGVIAPTHLLFLGQMYLILRVDNTGSSEEVVGG